MGQLIANEFITPFKIENIHLDLWYNDWFKAATVGDYDFLRRNVEQLHRLYDIRLSSPDNVFLGFAAIHYAAYFGNYDCFELLAPYEIDVLTEETHELEAPGISENSRINLGQGASCLMLALINNEFDIVEYIVHNIVKYSLFLTKIITKNGLTTLSIACMCNEQIATQILLNKFIINDEIGLVIEGDLTPVAAAAFSGEKENLIIMDFICFRNANLLLHFAKEVLQKCNNELYLTEEEFKNPEILDLVEILSNKAVRFLNICGGELREISDKYTLDINYANKNKK